MTDEHHPAGICLVTARATARLVIRHTTPGHATAWPMLVVRPCPFTDPWQPRRHAHIHYMTEPGPPWYRTAPCTWQPYLIEIEAEAE